MRVIPLICLSLAGLALSAEHGARRGSHARSQVKVRKGRDHARKRQARVSLASAAQSSTTPDQPTSASSTAQSVPVSVNADDKDDGKDAGKKQSSDADASSTASPVVRDDPSTSSVSSQVLTDDAPILVVPTSTKTASPILSQVAASPVAPVISTPRATSSGPTTAALGAPVVKVVSSSATVVTSPSTPAEAAQSATTTHTLSASIVADGAPSIAPLVVGGAHHSSVVSDAPTFSQSGAAAPSDAPSSIVPDSPLIVLPSVSPASAVGEGQASPSAGAFPLLSVAAAPSAVAVPDSPLLSIPPEPSLQPSGVASEGGQILQSVLGGVLPSIVPAAAPSSVAHPLLNNPLLPLPSHEPIIASALSALAPSSNPDATVDNPLLPLPTPAGSIASAASSAIEPLINEPLLPIPTLSAASVAFSEPPTAPLLTVPSVPAPVPSTPVETDSTPSPTLLPPSVSTTDTTTKSRGGLKQAPTAYSAQAALASSLQSVFGSVETKALLTQSSSTPAFVAVATPTAAPTTSAASSGDNASSDTSSSSSSSAPIVPPSVPAKIVPPTAPVPTKDDAMASLLLSPALSYNWLLQSTDTASQIFAFMPALIAGALNISSSQVETVAIVPYTSNGNTLAVWTGLVPADEISTLQAMALDRSSALYKTGSGPIKQLAQQLDPSLPVAAYGGSVSAAFASTSGSTSTEGSSNHTTVIAITSSFGAAVLLLGAFVTVRARNLRKRSPVQAGPVHLGGPENMREARLSTLSSLSGSSHGSSSSREHEYDWANLGGSAEVSRRASDRSSQRRIRSGRVSISRPTLQGNSLMM